jgi:hypothetical protein
LFFFSGADSAFLSSENKDLPHPRPSPGDFSFDFSGGPFGLSFLSSLSSLPSLNLLMLLPVNLIIVAANSPSSMKSKAPYYLIGPWSNATLP